MSNNKNQKKSSRYRPKSKRKKKNITLLKEDDEDDDNHHRNKRNYVMYKDKCVICMVMAALIVIIGLHRLNTSRTNAASIPRLVGKINTIVDELDKETNKEFNIKTRTRKKKKKGSIDDDDNDGSVDSSLSYAKSNLGTQKPWQVWNISYHDNIRLSAHLYRSGYEPSNIFNRKLDSFYVGFGYPIILNFEFIKVPKKPIVAYKIAGHPTHLIEKQNPGHWLFFGSFDGTPPWVLLDERHVGPSFLSKGLLRGSTYDGVILCLQFPRTRIKSIRMKILSNSGWNSEITALSRMEFLTEDQHKHCKHKFVDKSIKDIHKNAGTQGATFTSSSLIEDHGPEHVDDKSQITFWESEPTKEFPVWIEINFVKIVQIFSYHLSRTDSIDKSPSFFRLIGYTSNQANRKTDVDFDNNNIGITLDERVLQGADTSLKTIKNGGTHFCIYPNHHGIVVKKVRLNIFRTYGHTDNNRRGVPVALARFFVTTHEEEEEALGNCDDRR